MIPAEIEADDSGILGRRVNAGFHFLQKAGEYYRGSSSGSLKTPLSLS